MSILHFLLLLVILIRQGVVVAIVVITEVANKLKGHEFKELQTQDTLEARTTLPSPRNWG